MSQKKFLDCAVPAGAGSYAPEELYLNAENDKTHRLDEVHELTISVESLPATATIEIDLLKADGTLSPAAAANWLTAQKTITVVGLAATISLSGWYGVRVRVKSGGTAGSCKLHVSWF